MSITVSVTGQAELGRILARLDRRSTADVQAVVNRYAKLIEREAKGFAPVDTGALRDDIRTALEELAATVFTDLPYSAAVELGRADLPNYPVQAYLQPAFNTHSAAFVRAVAGAVARATA